MIKQSIITIATLGLLTISASAIDTAACAACHGAKFEKKALGKSNIVNEMKKADIEAKLKEFKGADYKGTMKGFAAKLSEDDIKAIAEKFGK